LIKDKFKIPLVIKGIATAEDALIAVDHGVEWIYVSNHGGRQLRPRRGAMQCAAEIVDAVRAGQDHGPMAVLPRRGRVKAIASGADSRRHRPHAMLGVGGGRRGRRGPHV